LSLSLWMLLAFSGWTLLILLIGVGVYRWSLILTGRAALSSFPGDTPHGGDAYRRAVRAHANCIENLPVFGAVVLVAAVSGLDTPRMDMLAVVVVAARIVQSSIHMLRPQTDTAIAWRFSFYTVQALAMIAMGVMIVIAAVQGHR
jgi:uncharacterized MAPEG superfamily protein